jgi:REP element-mobilizing transposase RayT
LRGSATFRVVKSALRAGAQRDGFRLVHYSVQSNHLHLIVEAHDAEHLSRGVAGLCVRLARHINRHFGRRGRLFATRFHARPLKTPREVRNALAYVLLNHRRHGARLRDDDVAFDPCSSSACFDGWHERPPDLPHDVVGTRPPRTWLLTTGWRRHRLLRTDETPGR